MNTLQQQGLIVEKPWDEPLTVAELLAILGNLPGDAVVLHDDDTRPRAVTRVRLEKSRDAWEVELS